MVPKAVWQYVHGTSNSRVNTRANPTHPIIARPAMALHPSPKMEKRKLSLAFGPPWMKTRMEFTGGRVGEEEMERGGTGEGVRGEERGRGREYGQEEGREMGREGEGECKGRGEKRGWAEGEMEIQGDRARDWERQREPKRRNQMWD